MDVNIINKCEGTVKANVIEENDNINVHIFYSEGKRPLNECKVGQTIIISGIKFTILEKSGDTVAVVSKNSIGDLRFGNNNNYLGSSIEKYLNGEFFQSIAASIGSDNIIEHTVDLRAGDGLDTYGKIKNKISLLTIDLYRRYRRLLPNLSKDWWLATACSTTDNNISRGVCVVRSDGLLDWGGCDFCYGVRPYFILNSSIYVSLLD